MHEKVEPLEIATTTDGAIEILQRQGLNDEDTSVEDESFTAEGNDGKAYTVHVITDSVNVGTMTDRTAEISCGPKRLRTSEGRTVMWIRNGEYKILKTGVMLTSDSPNAP
jgi:hypothetical protein